MNPTSQTKAPKKNMTWLFFALSTVACWGVYGIYLHMGQLGMADPVNGRYKAFLLVGIAYFVTAILGPVLVLAAKDGNMRFWEYPLPGLKWSFIAGIVGAAGAFFVLLAMGAGGSPAAVMSIVFAGAPVVNAIVGLTLHPPKGGWAAIPVPFYLGILLAVAGGTLVTLYKPTPPPAKKAEAAATGIDVSRYEIARHD